MRSRSLSWIFALGLTVSLLPPALSGQFALKDDWQGRDFYEGWNWETFDDPTHGRVNYVSKDTAIALNLTSATDESFIMRASTSRVLTSWDRGRDSVRISSKSTYVDSLVIADIKHMPTGCGTWPAFWSVTRRGPWPAGGEIDIVEGVHKETRNLVSLHTLPGCEMRPQRYHSGTPTSNACDANLNNNQGCGVQSVSSRSFGAPFNAAGGGWFAMRRTQRDGVAVWFWSRDDPSVPLEVSGLPGNGSSLGTGVGEGLLEAIVEGKEVIQPSEHWGTPQAAFPPEKCDMNKYFNEHVLVFDLTFCGDWAGEPAVWAGAGCGSRTSGACNAFVDNHPEAFAEAYWDVKSVRVYTPVAGTGS